MTKAEAGGLPPEQALDPEDWPAFRKLAHAMLDDMIDYQSGVGERKVWRPIPPAVRQSLHEPPPRAPQNLGLVYERFRTLVLPYPTGNIHPRFFGWVHGAGTASGMLAELLAAAMNSNLGGRDHMAVEVERQVVGWWREIFGLPESASGLLTSGSAMANLTALAVARAAKAPVDVRQQGVAAAPERLIAYASSEVHGSVPKAMGVLGLGEAALRRVPVDAALRLDVAALKAAIAADRAAGCRPFCVIATAGTVKSGAIDDLATLGALCQAEDLWFHVDGAFGALAILSPRLKPLLEGIEQASSLAFDFHKWLNVPYGAGCLLVRDGKAHRQAFASTESYLGRASRGAAGGGDWFWDFGIELSRPFRALKVWFAMKEYGLDRFGRLVEQNCAQAHYLADLVAADPHLELLAPVNLNIVCFRYRAGGMTPEALDAVNQEIILDLHEQGIAVPSGVAIAGRQGIRAALVNHRTRRADLKALAEAVVRLGAAALGKPAL